MMYGMVLICSIVSTCTLFPPAPRHMRKPHTKEVKIGEAFPRDDRIG